MAPEPRMAGPITRMRIEVQDFSRRAVEAGVPGDYLDIAGQVLNVMAPLPEVRFTRSDLVRLALPEPEGDQEALDEWASSVGIIDRLIEQMADPDSALFPISGYWRSEGEPGSDEYMAWFDPDGFLIQSDFQSILDFYNDLRRPSPRAPRPEKVNTQARPSIDEALKGLTPERDAVARAILRGDEIAIDQKTLRDLKLAIQHLTGASLAPGDRKRLQELATEVGAFQLRLSGELGNSPKDLEDYKAYLGATIRRMPVDLSPPIRPKFDPRTGRCTQPDVPLRVRRAFTDDNAPLADREKAAALCYKTCRNLFRCLEFGMKSDADGWGMPETNQAGLVVNKRDKKASGVYGGTLPDDRRRIRNTLLEQGVRSAEAVYVEVRNERDPVRKKAKST